jgi:hypothetical protein
VLHDSAPVCTYALLRCHHTVRASHRKFPNDLHVLPLCMLTCSGMLQHMACVGVLSSDSACIMHFQQHVSAWSTRAGASLGRLECSIFQHFNLNNIQPSDRVLISRTQATCSTGTTNYAMHREPKPTVRNGTPTLDTGLPIITLSDNMPQHQILELHSFIF